MMLDDDNYGGGNAQASQSKTNLILQSQINSG